MLPLVGIDAPKSKNEWIWMFLGPKLGPKLG